MSHQLANMDVTDTMEIQWAGHCLLMWVENSTSPMVTIQASIIAGYLLTSMLRLAAVCCHRLLTVPAAGFTVGRGHVGKRISGLYCHNEKLRHKNPLPFEKTHKHCDKVILTLDKYTTKLCQSSLLELYDRTLVIATFKLYWHRWRQKDLFKNSLQHQQFIHVIATQLILSGFFNRTWHTLTTLTKLTSLSRPRTGGAAFPLSVIESSKL